MPNAMVTVCARIASDRLDEALSRIRALGNPASAEIAAALAPSTGEEGVHFASLHALPATDPHSRHGHLVLELSADGLDAPAIDRLAACIGPQLQGVFSLAADWTGADLAAYLKGHRIGLGQGWFGEAGLPFAGTPGMTVGRIHAEAALADRIAGWVGGQPAHVPALDRLDDIRAQVGADPALAWSLQTPCAPPTSPGLKGLGLIAPVGLSFARTYLWPLAIPLAVVLLTGLLSLGHATAGFASDSGWTTAWRWVNGAWRAFLWVLAALTAFAVPVLALLVLLYVSLRRAEATDGCDERAPRRDVLQAILQVENHCAQNHMVSVTVRKPGITRWLTQRLAFWIIGALATLNFKPGHLGDIGTIHFARWVTLPGTRDLVFFSNYGGSWESYLEDFITKAHNGLTAVWSNTVGFPRTENLFGKGATDGERFKRYARRSMWPTPFWYSAYPTLTTSNIRTNAAIRRGLAAATTDEEAIAWLALFGSSARPAPKLESDQIQSLVFGGLGFMPHGTLLVLGLAEDRAMARAWLSDVAPQIAWDDGRRLKRDAVVTLALGPGALRKAGLPADALETFPAAYLDGMAGPGRGRILGDDPDEPWWWDRAGARDVALLIYGTCDDAVTTLRDALVADVLARGHTVEYEQPLHEIPKAPGARLEPFGFVDGVSQPAIRGAYRGLRNADPIHLVEPGEFILGYPDNRGNAPPGPSMDALHDPHNRLPLRCDNQGGFASGAASAPREIGRNGSFLVVRQLEQDVAAFHAYCEAEAERLQGRLGEPYEITPDFVAAKLVGRWPDGSSLARNPYQPFTEAGPLEQSATVRPTSRPAGAATLAGLAPRAVSPPPAAVAQVAPSAAEPAKPTGEMAAPPPEGSPLRPYPSRAADNDFLFGVEDPQGLRCPFGAHIRRANPRDSLDPGSQDQIDISNRHRILRVGRTYVAKEGQGEGLMFMCLNGDLERQFEFVQQTWMGSETFHGLSGERDALAGNRSGCAHGFTVPTRDGPIRLRPMSRFVTARGGGYFFLPGRKLVDFLSGPS